jgi:hypothetical protein
VTRAELLALVRQQTLISTTELADAAVVALINEGLADVGVRAEWPWAYDGHSFDFEVDTASYALPTDLNFLKEVIYSGQGAWAQPHRTTLESVRARFGDDVGEADLPPEYYRTGTTLTFVPTPTSTQTVVLRFYKEPDSLDETTDAPTFNAAFHPMLADYAIAKLWEREEMEEKANFYWSRYFDHLDRMIQFYNVQLPSEPMIVGGGNPVTYRKPWTNWPEV